MGSGNADNLKRAAQAKREAAIAKAEKGLRKLLKARTPITFQAVAAEAGVSKDFLYRTADLRARIIVLREKTVLRHKNIPAPQHAAPDRTDVSSVIRTLTARLTEERSTNRNRISELESALAAAQGEILQLRRLVSTHPAREPGAES